MLKITKPNGVVFHVPDEKLAEVVLELSGGGWTEKQTMSAMADSALLRQGRIVKINGYKLQLVKE